MKCCYSPINAGNMANGRNIKSSHLSHLGTLRKDIKITIKYHKTAGKESPIYSQHQTPRRGTNSFSIHI